MARPGSLHGTQRSGTEGRTIKPATLTIGVTGHRWNKLDAATTPRVAAELGRLFAAIDDAVRSPGMRVAPARAAERRTCLISGLAEGADQLAFQAAPAGWRKVAILPFPRTRYLMDFAPEHATGAIDRRPELEAALRQADVVLELEDTGDALAGYERAGSDMLAASDLLLAIWDGKESAGRGGTETVVQQALETMPVIWIHAADPAVPTRFLSGHGTDARSEPATNAVIASKLQLILTTPPKYFPAGLS